MFANELMNNFDLEQVGGGYHAECLAIDAAFGGLPRKRDKKRNFWHEAMMKRLKDEFDITATLSYDTPNIYIRNNRRITHKEVMKAVREKYPPPEI